MWLMDSPWPVITILAAYLYFVLKIGPEFMKYRRPMNIDRVVMVYNIIQVLFSLYIVREVIIIFKYKQYIYNTLGFYY
jgi:hypothetical protein